MPQVNPVLGPRDYELLRCLFECRMMTLTHATTLFFGGKYEAATKRLQALKAGGYVGDRRNRVGEPSLLYLTSKAFDCLRSAGKLDGLPALSREQFLRRARIRPQTVEHELSVMDVRVAITAAVAAHPDYVIEQFTTWPLLNEFFAIHPTRRHREPVRPDGFLRIVSPRDDQEHSFFLEVDRSNEVQRVLEEKALCYREFYASGGFAERSGGRRDEFKDYPFRVLMVLRGQERRNNLAERLMNCTPPVKSQVYLTTFEDVVTNPLGQIWIYPLEYARATAGTIYAPEYAREQRIYVRRSERERLVEERVTKRTLFAKAD